MISRRRFRAIGSEPKARRVDPTKKGQSFTPFLLNQTINMIQEHPNTTKR